MNSTGTFEAGGNVEQLSKPPPFSYKQVQNFSYKNRPNIPRRIFAPLFARSGPPLSVAISQPGAVDAGPAGLTSAR